MRAFGCGGRIRTDNLRIMSPTSYHCSTPRRLVEGAGFEPAKAAPADLQSAPVGHLGTPPRIQLSAPPAASGRLCPEAPSRCIVRQHHRLYHPNAVPSRSVGQPPPSASEAAGAGDGTRTHNRSLTRRLLCRLSYPSPPPHGPGARLRPWHWHRHRHRHGHGRRHRTAGAAAPATDTAIATDTDTGTDTATAIVTDTATATSTAITTDTDNAADNAAAAAGKPHADAGRTPSIVAARGLRVQVYDDAGRCTMRSLRRFP